MMDADHVAELVRFVEFWRTEWIILPCCFIVGLAMRADPRLRTHAGTAVLGAIAMVIISGDRAVGFYVLSGATFVYVRMIDRFTQLSRWNLAAMGAIGIAVAFLIRSAAGDLVQTSPILTALDMHLSLRLVVFVWEFGAGRIPSSPGGVEFLAWCGLPFTLSNPIMRYSEYQRQTPWANPPPPIGLGWWIGVVRAVLMLLGAAALFVVEGVFWRADSSQHWYGKLPIVYGTQPWAWYLGLMAVAVLHRLAGVLGGIAVPVNFDSPYQSRSIGEFWTRWNISATSAFRDMLFYNRWGRARPNMYLNSVIVFLTIGLWHGVSVLWVLFGLCHGLGFCVYLTWRKWRGSEARPLPYGVSWLITYIFICSCSAAPYQIRKVWWIVSARLEEVL